MRRSGPTWAWAVAPAALGLAISSARGQATPTLGNPNQVAAKVERAALVLVPPDRYAVPIILEPLRRITLDVPADGVLRGVPASVGAVVKDGQEIARLDSAAALARHRIAVARVKMAEAEAATNGKGPFWDAKIEVARAEADLAQMEVESCILRAPFGGRITAIKVFPGQYLTRGTTILELDDATSVRALIPVERPLATIGSSLAFTIEGAPASGKVQAVVPLPDTMASLRELASPLAAAWVVVANPTGAFEPGQRVQSPSLPNAPIAAVASFAIRQDDPKNPTVQVIRAERVTDVPVRLLGPLGPERTQVSGPFRPSDVLIQTASVPLRAGTFIRFNDAAPRGVEGQPPPASQVGESAEVALPPGVAPIGSGGRPRPAPARGGTPTSRPTGDGTVPF